MDWVKSGFSKLKAGSTPSEAAKWRERDAYISNKVPFEIEFRCAPL